MTFDPSTIYGCAGAIVVGGVVLGAILRGHQPRDDAGELHPDSRKTLRKFERERMRIAHENRKHNKRRVKR